MSAFDIVVEKAIEQNPDCAVLRPVVEKEILHGEILRAMNGAGMLEKLTFMGGTALRSCYNAERLSEDLDFAGDFDFSKEALAGLGECVKNAISKKYGLQVEVLEPQKENGNVDTWRLKIVTRPERRDLPSQKINVDICHVPSREKTVQIIANRYGVDFGGDDIFIFAESLGEILCDKLIAVANRPNRVKFRDLWDIFWLSRKNVAKNDALLAQKLADRKIAAAEWTKKFDARIASLENLQGDFLREMRRFLFPKAFTATLQSEKWWRYLLQLLRGMRGI